ncbi:GPR1/FUN34/yaaH family-domain-containing protein [Aspergillus pseudoustus]|uniref:GPR1/FUN34/yaaH family-domain-containing protein n=1 Tax=Aspergillus pseudoustus TaxID=1810923 RepID=A0ABR4IDS2_9EURO
MATTTTEPEKYDLKNTITNATTPSPPSEPLHAQSSHLDYANTNIPLTHTITADSRLPAFGGAFQPGLYRPPKKVANPAPLGLCAFGLTVFLLGCLEMKVRDITQPSILVGSAFAYGGLVQLLAGMWEMAIGNSFGATVLSSYGGFWISAGIIFTPGGFNIIESLQEAAGGSNSMFYDSLGLMLLAWFIFTVLMTLITLKSTLAFFSLFLCADISLLLLGVGYIHRDAQGMPTPGLVKSGGFFAILCAFLCWYNAFAGLADPSNSFFVPPVVHFPWSEMGRKERKGRGGGAGEV